mmetsp:Transcript_29854/g.69557  ORF Transcript_29854/g.69557 Transcript_29854/m.69557 type:complete len:100 (+) Transcript_29854:187-486(+)
MPPFPRSKTLSNNSNTSYFGWCKTVITLAPARAISLSEFITVKEVVESSPEVGSSKQHKLKLEQLSEERRRIETAQESQLTKALRPSPWQYSHAFSDLH